jgi:hypothetical protein
MADFTTGTSETSSLRNQEIRRMMMRTASASQAMTMTATAAAALAVTVATEEARMQRLR